ncbi:DUF4340 domain-containing protein [Porticoccus sp.]
MTKMKTWLSALLVIQLALAIGLYWNTQNELQKNLPQPLIDIDWQALNHLVVGDSNHQVTLGKGSNGWLLTKQGNLPVMDGNTEALLEKLKTLQTSWPVASTRASHDRFEVTEDKANRYVAFYQDDRLLGKLIVGSSPGLHKLHVRMDGENNVYTVPLELVDMITSDQSWFDKSLLAAQSLESIQGADYSLQKIGEQWKLHTGTPQNDSGENPELNSGSVADIIYALQGLQVRKLVTELPDLSNSGYAQLAVKVAGKDKPLTYQFYQTKERCYVTRSDYDAMFSIGWSDYEKIAEMDIEKLTVQQQSSEEVSPGGTADATQS